MSGVGIYVYDVSYENNLYLVLFLKSILVSGPQYLSKNA
jgi:hypothetical protein